MNRRFSVLFLLAAVCVFSFFGHSNLRAEEGDGALRITTREAAAELASRLANERCEASFGKSPFTPDSYVPQLSDSRWSWGRIEPAGTNGFSAEIGFNTDGSERKVRVVYHLPPVQGERIIRKKE